MTRETKIGLAVGASFLCLVGGVVAVRTFYRDRPADDKNAVIVADPPKITLPPDMDTEPPAPSSNGEGGMVILPTPPPPTPAPGGPVIKIDPEPNEFERLGKSAQNPPKTTPEPDAPPSLSVPINLESKPTHPPASPVITIASVDPPPSATKPKTEAPPPGPVLTPPETPKTTSPMSGGFEIVPSAPATLPTVPATPTEVKDPSKEVKPEPPPEIKIPAAPMSPSTSGPASDPAKTAQKEVRPEPPPEIKVPAAPMSPSTSGPTSEPKPVTDPKTTQPETPKLEPSPGRTIELPKTVEPAPIRTTTSPILEPPPVISRPTPMPPAEPSTSSPGVRLGTPAPAPSVDSHSMAPSAARQDPKQDSYEEEWYRCQAGDKLEAISQRLFGTPRYAQALRLYNLDRQFSENLRQENPLLRAGQIIRIPEKRILERTYSGSNTSGSRSGMSAPPNGGGTDDAATLPEWRVPRENMTLHEIAKEQLGNSGDWYKIFELNRWLNPNEPVPMGAKIYLPRTATHQ